MAYRTLDAACVVETIDRLERRIGERFPDSGLRKVCRQLGETSRRCASEAARLNTPARALRFSVYALYAIGAVALVWLAIGLHIERIGGDALAWCRCSNPR